MLFKSYDFLDRFWDYLSFQPPMLSQREFMSIEGSMGHRPGSMPVMFSSNILFVVNILEIVDVDTWVHEFVELSLSGVITEILRLRPFMSIPVRLFDERLGWRSASFCHYLAALTTGQGWWDEKCDHCTMEADEVWLWMESSLEHIKNGLKYEAGNNK